MTITLINIMSNNLIIQEINLNKKKNIYKIFQRTFHKLKIKLKKNQKFINNNLYVMYRCLSKCKTQPNVHKIINKIINRKKGKRKFKIYQRILL